MKLGIVPIAIIHVVVQ